MSGLAEKSPRQGQLLPFADTQLAAVEELGAELRIVTVGQALHRSIDPSQPGGLGHRLVTGLGVDIAQPDVVADAQVVVNVILEDHADLALPGDRIELLEIDPVQGDRPLLGIVEAAEQLDQRRFAGTVFADQGDHFSRPQLEIDLVQRLPRGPGIGKTDVFEEQPLPGKRRQVKRLLGCLDTRFRNRESGRSWSGTGCPRRARRARAAGSAGSVMARWKPWKYMTRTPRVMLPATAW